MTDEKVKKIATIKLFERRLSPLKKPMYVITFLADDGEVYRKIVTQDQPHWKTMFFNMGQDEPDFMKVEPLIGNKVELVIGESGQAQYVNRLTLAQQLEMSSVLDVIGEKNLVEKVLAFLKGGK